MPVRGWMVCLATGCAASCTSPAKEGPAAAEVQAPPAEPVPLQADATPDEGPQAFEAVVEIDDKPGGKRLQAVWLVGPGDRRRVISYRADPWWTPFDGKRVTVTGEAYEPKGQAIGAEHFEVARLELSDPQADPEAELTWVEAEREYSGTFELYDWPKKAKGHGTKATVFVSEGTSYWIASATPDVELDKPVTVRARPVEPSNFVARPGGPYLWIIEVGSQ